VKDSRPEVEPEWLTVTEAADYHHKHTPRKRPIHRSAIYRWLRNGRVLGEERGGTMYVQRASLAAFCAGRPVQVAGPLNPSEPQRGKIARNRIMESMRRPRSGGLR